MTITINFSQILQDTIHAINFMYSHATHMYITFLILLVVLISASVTFITVPYVYFRDVRFIILFSILSILGLLYYGSIERVLF